MAEDDRMMEDNEYELLLKITGLYPGAILYFYISYLLRWHYLWECYSNEKTNWGKTSVMDS